MINIKTKKTSAMMNPNWFDKDCVKEKHNIWHIGKWVKKEPNNKNLRENLSNSKREFKKLTREKKRKYRENIVKNMHLSKCMFWKSLNKLGDYKNKNHCIERISLDSWREHDNNSHYSHKM